jgi:hypothetical protein
MYVLYAWRNIDIKPIINLNMCLLCKLKFMFVNYIYDEMMIFMFESL